MFATKDLVLNIYNSKSTGISRRCTGCILTVKNSERSKQCRFKELSDDLRDKVKQGK